MYNSDLRTVNIGVQNSYLYPMSQSGFGGAIKQLGMIEASRKVSQEDTPIYADNRVHVSVSGTKTVEGELTHLQMSPEYYEFLGWYINSNGALTDSGSKKAFTMAFASKIIDEFGKEKYEINVFYNLRGTEPELSKKTMEDKVEAESLKVSYTASPTSLAKDDMGNDCSFMKVVLDGVTEEQVCTILEAGCPLPTSAFPV